jgi:hypothetical protein
MEGLLDYAEAIRFLLRLLRLLLGRYDEPEKPRSHAHRGEAVCLRVLQTRIQGEVRVEETRPCQTRCGFGVKLFGLLKEVVRTWSCYMKNTEVDSRSFACDLLHEILSPYRMKNAKVDFRSFTCVFFFY